MSTSAGGPTLAHRTVTSIRSGAIQSPGPPSQSGPGSPHTPIRGSSSAFSSPSSLRADEETLVIELGSRFLRIGFAGDSVPKAIVPSGPGEHRRAGDFTTWLPEKRRGGNVNLPSDVSWGSGHEIWRPDLRSSDLGLVADKLERAMREAFTNHLLIDSRPRRVCLVLPPALPLPLLSTVLDTLFNRFQAPAVSLASSSVMAAMAAGVRSAIVVDIGWSGTTVSSVYEYREIRHTRSSRAGRMLVQEVYNTLASCLSSSEAAKAVDFTRPTLSFEDCEEVARRLIWTRQMVPSSSTRKEGLATVVENDESATGKSRESDGGEVQLELSSLTQQGRATCVPVRRLADPCENTFIASQYSRSSFDDEEIPLPELIYQHLLSLPIDVRATCMSRIVYTGGCAKIPGLRQRLFDEVSYLLSSRGWDAVVGRGADAARARAKEMQFSGGGGTGFRGCQMAMTRESDKSLPDDMVQGSQVFPTREFLGQAQNSRDVRRKLSGELRALESLGPWTGASLAIQLKTVAVATVDRELWLQQGMQGASKPNEVDLKAQQRQSLGPGIIRGTTSSTSTNWTLGGWGPY